MNLGPAAGGAARSAFEYVVLRAVPRVDRGELINVGVVVYSQGHDYLGCATHLDEPRLLALDPGVDVDEIRAALGALEVLCRGRDAEGAPPAPGPAGERGATGADPAGRRREVTPDRPADQSRRVRFGWLAAPRSTVVQPGPIHTGLTRDPAAELDRLVARLVLRPGGRPGGRPARTT